jgi:transposase
MPRKEPPKRRAFDTDLSDGQWALIKPLIPRGCPRKGSTRDLIEAILYLLRAGSSWRLLPHDLPSWQTVYCYLRRWQREGVWNRVPPCW